MIAAQGWGRVKQTPKRAYACLGTVVLTDGTEGRVTDFWNDARNPGVTYQAIRVRLKRGERDPARLFAPAHSGRVLK
jgi:hypothetical protein